MIAALMPSDLPRSDTGDHGAFVQAAAELRPLVRAIVAAMLNESREHPDVEDCTHEVMRRALEGRDRLREGEPIKPWVGGIARHVALDALRARKKQRQRAAFETVAADDSDHDSALDRVADTAPSPLENVEHAERQSALRRALETLPDGQRRALQMFHIEGLAYQEISSKLDVPLGTVATWVTRARKSVAEAIVREKMPS